MHISSRQSSRSSPGLGLHDIMGGGYIILSPAKSGTEPVVSSGVTVKSRTISSGVDQAILKGGAAIDTTVLGGGIQSVYGTTTGTVLTGSVFSKRTLISEQIVYAGGVAVRTTVDARAAGGGGTASGIAIENRGRQVVEGQATSTTVGRGGVQEIDGGGVAMQTIVENGGLQCWSILEAPPAAP